MAIGIALEEVLTTSSGAVDAGHHAEKGIAITHLGYLGSHRSPNSVWTSIIASVPKSPDLTGSGRLEENDLLLIDRILGIGASRCASAVNTEVQR